jgi:hypothetical protein
VERHPSSAASIIGPYVQGLNIHPNDPPLPHRGPGQ